MKFGFLVVLGKETRINIVVLYLRHAITLEILLDH